jgi:NAD-dependent deacetylase
MINAFEETTSLAAKLITEANNVVILSGAGLSTPSGIPDFRSAKTGMWETNDPMQVASLSAFRYRPNDFFNWLKPLSEKIYYAKPNAAHTALATLEQIGKIKAIVTQNIDCLHQKAGSNNVIEVHGSIANLECPKCVSSTPFDEVLMQNFIKDFSIPACEQCGSNLKPSITLFEEMLPYDAWNLATHHFEYADLVIVVGSSLEVSPANQLPMIGKSNGAKLIINTLSTTHLDSRANLLINYDVVAVWKSILDKFTI